LFQMNSVSEETRRRKFWRFVLLAEKRTGLPHEWLLPGKLLPVETDSLGPAPRPFHYMFAPIARRSAGRTVLLYSPSDAVIKHAS